MDYNTEVIRDVDHLRIRWRNEAGDLWTVKKRFNLHSGAMEDATIDCSAQSWPLAEAEQAKALAEQMDAIFTRLEDFDRVRLERGRYAPDGMPAHIRSYGGNILIAVARPGAQ